VDEVKWGGREEFFRSNTIAKAVATAETIKAPSSPQASAPLQSQGLVVVDGDAFMGESIKPRKVLLRTMSHAEPVFFEQSINQIFAWRGVGKSCLGFGLTAVFAKGGKFLNWEVPERTRVLYIEGELPESQVQERWKQIIGTTNGYARLVTIDKQPGHMFPSFASATGMDAVEATLARLKAEGFDTKVLFLDSISTLFNVAANDEENWITIQSWLISLRSRGLCVFFFHHAGKSGMSRSHSKSEDMLDISIKLEAPTEKETGCLHAVLTYDKARAGLSEQPTEIKMRRTHSDSCLCRKNPGEIVIGCRGDQVKWECRSAIDAKKAEAIQMFSENQTVRQIAKSLKVPVSTVGSWRSAWVADRNEREL
jgi:RecA-family ATPase